MAVIYKKGPKFAYIGLGDEIENNPRKKRDYSATKNGITITLRANGSIVASFGEYFAAMTIKGKSDLLKIVSEAYDRIWAEIIEKRLMGLATKKPDPNEKSIAVPCEIQTLYGVDTEGCTVLKQELEHPVVLSRGDTLEIKWNVEVM